MSLRDLLNGLDREQEKAVTLVTNGVAAAGAGSGKTKVLASRYAWLVMEKNLKPDEILTLTFTNKAVSEMYSRIYRYLLEQSAPETGDAGPETERAAAALREFHKARISTLDSFSAGIARTAAARYGISPDFSSDDTALRDLAREAALSYVLDNRNDPAVRGLLVDHKIRELAEEIFTRVVLNYSAVSSPLDFGKFLLVQKEELLRAWREKGKELDEITGRIKEELDTLKSLKKSIALTELLEELLFRVSSPSLPDISPLLETGTAKGPETGIAVRKYFDYYSKIIAARTPGNYREEFTALVESFRRIKGKDKDGLYHKLEAIANYALNFDLCAGVSKLLEKFQDRFNAKKRETRFLSFNDIAHLAVDALKDHPDIRKIYKDSIRMIMIDEFQDNNALQRDLIYLLAENSSRKEKSVPAPEELEKNRMFFVGDEKQSIYRFRGADVAVFRSLGNDLFGGQNRDGSENGGIELAHNYRSRPGLIAVFNFLFGGLDAENPEKIPEALKSNGVFLTPGPEVPGYEALYSRVRPPENSSEEKTGPEDAGPLAHFCFLNGGDLPDDDAEGIKSHDLEAAFIAEKIRSMVLRKEKIRRRTNSGIELTECAWGDFAVLQRSYTHQGALEKYFREFGVPYNTDRPSGLFSDAPLLDLLAYLRLIVYPEDKIAYAALIRSPFMRLGDLTLAVCMLGEKKEPFSEENDALIPEDDIELYRRARERYRALREESRNLPVTELLIKLWFEEAYRPETIWSEAAQVYESLFDLFFSLACDTDSRGGSLADFIEYADDVMKREEKPDDKDIPGEGESGVRIMSIHKSKGLEFPVVFIYNCAQQRKYPSPALTSYHEKYGIVLDVPQAEELPDGGNYFHDIIKEEEKAKDIAELRRLLYVAMTRAECGLFLTFTIPKQTDKEKKEWDTGEGKFTEEKIRRRLSQYAEKSDGNQDTFLKLLSGLLPGCPSPLCAIEAIPVLSRAGIRHLAESVSPNSGGNKNKNGWSMREAAIAAEVYYEKAETLPPGEAGPESIDASKLRGKTQSSGGAMSDGEIRNRPSEKTAPGVSEIIPADFDPAEFGSLVHAVLEGRLNGRPVLIPQGIRLRFSDDKILQKLLSGAENMADGFLASDLGKRCAASKRREPEFPVITSAAVKGKKTAITGRIDLLFEEDDAVTVVDFKTDRTENPEDHYGQLAAYYRAAADIFGKPVSTWLFYLRSGRALDVTREVQNLSLEETAAAALLIDASST